MPTDRYLLHLDERTARLGRELYAEVRRQQQDVVAEEKLRRSREGDATGGSLWDALFSDSDADGSDGD